MYTVGQVSEMFHLPISTLRYYDKEGFFPNLERRGNIRYFSNKDLETLRIIECLKKSGLEIKNIRQFIDWIGEGAASYSKRKELFETRKAAVEAEIRQLEKTLSLLKFKCWYYETRITSLPCCRINYQRTFRNYTMRVTNSKLLRIWGNVPLAQKPFHGNTGCILPSLPGC